MRQIISLMAIALIGLFTANTALAQGLSVNTTGTAADGSAMLDVSSSTKGVLVPRMDSAHIAAINAPATGLLVFQTNGVTPGFYYYTGSGWSRVGATPLPQYFGLVASSGPNGSISPAGTSIASAGSTQVYSITPASGYSVGSVTVDGASVGAVSSYTLSAVSANHSVSATFASNLVVGQSYQGGIIAYILQPGDPGYNATTQHGLIVSASDISSNAVWGCSATTTGATGSTIGTGSANTSTILIACATSGIAAQICRAYSGGGYNDWYLPSADEAHQLNINRVAIGGFSSTAYWTSTEDAYDPSFANYVYIDGAYFTLGSSSKSNPASVRAVRSF